MKNNDWTLFKKTFTQEQEDAIWQYLIDHSKVQTNGFLGIQLYVKNVNDFWKRVWSRYSGEYTRYEKLEKEYVQANQTLSVMYQLNRKHQNRIIAIEKKGLLTEKICLFIYRKIRDYLFK